MPTRETLLAKLALLSQATLSGDPNYTISGVDTLESATEKDASFLSNPLYTKAMKDSRAGVICVDPQTPLEPGKNYLISDNPSQTFQLLIEHFLQPEEHRRSGFTGIHPTAVIHPSAKLEKNVEVGPYVVIDRDVYIGARSRILAHTSIGPKTTIGEDCLFYPNVTVREHTKIGNRVILQPGAVIGACGFGFITDAKGHHTKVEQLGIVEIGDDVEIGANTTIDRARFKTTKIAHGTKIDNLVQIGHNVELGPHNIIVSQTGISGSTKTGRNVVLGGQVGVVGHITLDDHVFVAAKGGVSKSLKSGKYAGIPVSPLTEYNKQQVLLRQIKTHIARINALEERLKALTS